MFSSGLKTLKKARENISNKISKKGEKNTTNDAQPVNNKSETGAEEVTAGEDEAGDVPPPLPARPKHLQAKKPESESDDTDNTRRPTPSLDEKTLSDGVSHLSVNVDHARVQSVPVTAVPSRASGADGDDVVNAAEAKRRNDVINEVIVSEKTYCGHLQAMIDEFVTPLSANDSSVLTSEDVGALFLNLPAVCEASVALLGGMKDLPDLTSDSVVSALGDLLGKMLEDVRPIYQEYVSGYQNALKSLAVVQTQPAFSDFCQTVRNNGRFTELNLSSILIMPVQRIPRYELLLKELLKHTPSHMPERVSLERALKTAEGLATDINTTLLASQHAASVHKQRADIDPLIGTSLPLIWQTANGFFACRRPPVRNLLSGKPAKHKLDKEATALLCDEHYIWIATTAGDVRMYNLKSDTCKALWKHGTKIVCRVLQWVGNYLWGGMANGTVTIFDTKKTVGKVTVVATTAQMRSMAIIDIVVLSPAIAWLVHSDGKISVCNTTDPAKPVCAETFDPGEPILCAMVVPSTGFVWAGSQTALSVYQCDEVKDANSVVSLQQKDVSPLGLEAIVSLTVTDPDTVCTAHVSQCRVALWNTKDMSHRETIDLEGFPVRHLRTPCQGVVWLAASDGRIRVLDTRNKFVLKDWTAHHDSLIHFTANTSLVASVSKQGNVRVYDASLENDWVDYQLEQREGEYTTPSELRMFIGTWNIGATGVDPDADLTTWLRPEGVTDNTAALPEVYAIGFQECVELNAKSVAVNDGKAIAAWETALTAALLSLTNNKKEYTLMFKEQLVGLVLFVFVKMTSVKYIRDTQGTSVKAGFKGLAGNKGGVCVSFMYGNTFVALVNAHLSAGQEKRDIRDQHQQYILASAKFESGKKPRVNGGLSLLDQDALVFFGDLNYRIDLDYDTCKKHIFERDWKCLKSYDQLDASLAQVRSWTGFVEEELAFAPTYKYDPGTNIYDTSAKKRSPAWCDRILCRGRAVKLSDYKRHELLQSDHRPVSAHATIGVKTFDETKRRALKKEIAAEYKASKVWDVARSRRSLYST